jgi:nitrite reductase/ring-hydroxylating ferredoxin subunit
MDTITTVLSLCRLTDIPDGGATAVDALLADGEQSLILLRDGEQVRGYRNVCPHAGRRLDYAPGKFLLKDDTLICAVHGASFQRQAGVCVAGPCRGDSLRAVPLRIEGGEVWLA